MCGIAGTAGGRQNAELLRAMAAAMVKRGPDGEGIWCDETVGLAFRRLAIIDLTDRSDQPMHLGALHLVFNGEIYNYKELRDDLVLLGHSFQSDGDAEVLLHAWQQWGEAALDRLNGMFAFAVWDDAKQLLTLARDFFGEKPLYYCHKPSGELVFGSELKTLFCDPEVDNAPDPSALAAFVGQGWMPDPQHSFFAKVARLPAAHVLRWEAGRIDVQRYWEPRGISVPSKYSDAVSELRDLLRDSIRLRLRSDVPVGTSLSGGIDSSAVVMLASQLAGDHSRHTFTASFPGYERDEWSYAHLVATAANVEQHHAVRPSLDGVLEDLELLVADQEEPFGSLSIYAQWSVNKKARAEGVKVLLDGQGADELFGGYAGVRGFTLRSLSQLELLRRAIQHPNRVVGPVGHSLAADYLTGPLLKLFRRRRASCYVNPEIVDGALLGNPHRPSSWSERWDPLRRELLAETFVTSLPELLRYADRSSMAHSREVRLPFLDRRIAQFAFSLPANFLYRGGLTKAILRDSLSGLVPAPVLVRRDKIAFEPPQVQWLSEPRFVSRIGEVLLDRAASNSDLYDRQSIERDIASGVWRDSQAIWRAFNAELWLAQFVNSRPALVAVQRPISV